MPQLTRFLTAALVISFAACAQRAARADYPDYAPSPPPAEAERGAGLLSEAELNRPIEPARAGESARSAEVTWGADPLRSLESPRPMGTARNPESTAAGELPRTEPIVAEPAEPPSPRPLPQQYRPIEQGLAAPGEQPSQVRLVSQRLPEAEPIPLARPSGEARTVFGGGDIPPLVTGAASLGIVLGLFLLVAWVVRRSMPKTSAVLPREAVEILGRAPLVGRQQVHLVRCGNKILLLSVSPSSVETLTEIDDPDEVDRLSGICQQMHPGGVAASFRQVYDHYGRPPRGNDYLATDEPDELDYGQLDPIGHRRSQEPRG